MGKRRPSRSGSGRRRGGGTLTGSLREHIKTCEIKSPTVDELVDYLSSKYDRDYSRVPLHALRLNIQKIIQENNSRKSKSILTDDDDDEEAIDFDDDTPQKKRKRADSREEKLQKLEAQHLRKIQTVAGSSASTASNASSSSEEEDDDEEELSTSEDRIYSEKFEPEFDLTKVMLRQNYSKKTESNAKKKGKEETLELEVVNNSDNKANKKVDVLREGNQSGRKVKLDRRRREGGGEGSSGGEGDGNGGPRFKDLGGMSGVIEELIMEVIVPLYHPQLPRYLGVRPMAGILLHGPPGCGKTKLAHAIANETGVPFYKISATELVSGISGASEENIRELFSKAYRTAPSIVFIDEIDAIASKRENLQREMERRIVTQLMTCMDDSNRLQPTDGNASSENSDGRPGYILVIGATNRPDAVDPALRRPGRFDREIVLGVPDENARIDILSKLTHKLKVDGAFDLVKIARSTPGFVGADLAALTYKAGNLAMKRVFDQRKAELCEQPIDERHAEDWWRQPWSPEEMEKLSITMADFEEAAKLVQPSSRREGFSAIPNVKWEDVGGLHMLRQEFDRYIVHRIKYPDVYADFGVDIETGFLLYGPPGCGKTLIAKAVANEAGANFIHVKGPELLNKYVGESELAVRTIFSRARTCSPCILFFDEVDALTTKRGREGGWVVERLLNQLLIELDGADHRKGVYVIGATNRPEIMDPAVLRPGRFGRLLYVPLPSPEERGLILKAVSRKKPIDPSVDLMAIAKDGACENLSGADLAALVNDAAMAAVQDIQTTGDRPDGTPRTIKDIHFTRALERIAPSVSDKQRLHYELLSQSFKFTSG